MIVVKLGGSLFGTPELNAWMQILADYSKQTPIVVVPGGGPFADQVRLVDTQYNLKAESAHHMALLAMKQFGLLLADIEPKAKLISTNGEITSPLSIWLPDDSLVQEASLNHSWAVTSDSIALWLASKLSANNLLLIKRSQINTASIRKLIQTHVIDSAFSAIFASNKIDAKILHYQNFEHFDSFSQLRSLYLP
ncbi:MAG: delta 1-pyrroline-5-carboxylate synthetase [Methylophaga sp.]|nr:delta 1-pyrroline-5-carboxylate synthetase [Methylophaga sp.]